jgi:hypothetical protein
MLIGITVSTNYANILDKIIHQDQQIFKKWYIITAENDEATINVIKKANYSHIEILYYNFNQPGCIFDKGGAVKLAQQRSLEEFGEGAPVLILDSDIYLTNEAITLLNNTIKTLKPNCIYGAPIRYLFKKHSDLLATLKHNGHLIVIGRENCKKKWTEIIGCFQLYLQTRDKIYTNSINCSACDFEFSNIFTQQNKIYLDITLYHLGVPGANWNGRIKLDDYIIDI